MKLKKHKLPQDKYLTKSSIIKKLLKKLLKLNRKRFNVSRRTAERMRDSVMLALPQVDEIETNERIKRWGFTSYTLSELVYFNSDEIAFLEKLKTNCDDVAQKTFTIC